MAFQKLSSKHSQIRRMVRRDISHPSVAAAWVAGPWSDCIPCPGVGERKTWGVAGIRNPLMNMFSWLFFIGIFIMVDDIYIYIYIYPPTPLPCLRGRRKGSVKHRLLAS